MAQWGRITSRGNVEDRRSLAPVAIGSIGLGGLALMLIFNVLTGSPIDLGQVLGELEQIQPQPNIPNPDFEGQDPYELFASTVLGSNNDMWKERFNANNLNYLEPKLVLFRQATQSSCGTAISQVGPHYCRLDNTIYLDETFFDELVNRFGASGGDVAEAYVISHEVAHHVQNQMGIMEEVEGSEYALDPNDASVRLELQADCFAGLWANSIKDQKVLEEGEIKEALDAAAAVGDDRIQAKVTGYINPESWTHGSSQDRVDWFMRGYETGNASFCNTFAPKL